MAMRVTDGRKFLPPPDPSMDPWEKAEYETLRISAEMTFAQRMQMLVAASESAKLLQSARRLPMSEYVKTLGGGNTGE